MHHYANNLRKNTWFKNLYFDLWLLEDIFLEDHAITCRIEFRSPTYFKHTIESKQYAKNNSYSSF